MKNINNPLKMSPCTKKCELNTTKTQCISCKRYVKEIMQWRDLPTTEKLKIMNDLSTRKVEIS